MTPRICCDSCEGESATDSPWQMGHFNCEATSCTRWSSVCCGGFCRKTYDQIAPTIAAAANAINNGRLRCFTLSPPHHCALRVLARQGTRACLSVPRTEFPPERLLHCGILFVVVVRATSKQYR